MSRRQRIVLASAAMAFVASALFPPWVERSVDDIDFGIVEVERGYHFIFLAPTARDPLAPPLLGVGIDWSKLGALWVIGAACAGIALLMAHDRKRARNGTPICAAGQGPNRPFE